MLTRLPAFLYMLEQYSYLTLLQSWHKGVKDWVYFQTDLPWTELLLYILKLCG